MFKEYDTVSLKPEFANKSLYTLVEVYTKEGETIARLFPLKGGFLASANVENLQLIKEA